MFDHLNTFDKVSVVAWVLIVVVFAPIMYRRSKGGREDLIEAGGLVGAMVMVLVTLLRPEWKSEASTLVIIPLLVLSLLERRSRKEK